MQHPNLKASSCRSARDAFGTLGNSVMLIISQAIYQTFPFCIVVLHFDICFFNYFTCTHISEKPEMTVQVALVEMPPACGFCIPFHLNVH